LRLALIGSVAVAGALVAGSCTKKANHGDGQVIGSVGASSDAAPSRSTDASDDGDAATAPYSASSWAESVRVGQWQQAARQLDSLDDKERSQPEIRYVRARAAIALNDYEGASKLLEGLEPSLQMLAGDIAFYRAEAQIHVGPVEEAARYFASQTGVQNLVKAALAWEKAGRHKEARETIERAVRAAGKKTNEAAVDARSVRARLAEAAGEKSIAATDLRFIARHDPSRADAEDIGEAIARLDPKSALTVPERIDRAHRMARDGNSQGALQELERAARSPGKRPSTGEMTYAKAMSLYLDRAHYSEAAEAFEQAARLDSGLSAEANWYAAKAWARADQNARAAARYREVARSFPKSRWAERASYQLARLEMLEGRWPEAAQTYATYLARYVRGDNQQAARYEHALCLLLAGQADRARKLLSEIADRSTDSLASANVRHLEAVAAYQAGDGKAAHRIWNEIVREQPLSWPALVATSRLVSTGQPAPVPIQPPPTSAPDPLSVTLPAQAALLRRLGLDHDAQQWLRDHEQDAVSTFAARNGEALCVMYGQLAEGHRRFSISLRATPASWLSMAPSASTRWAWECTYPKPYGSLVESLESRESIPKSFMHAIMRQESGFNSEARSHAGAHGLMQLLPNTARRIADESAVAYDPDQLCSPAQNMDLSARYLGKLSKNFQGNLVLVAAAYNAGPKAVARWMDRANGVPLDLWVARIPYAETRRYVWKVMSNYARYGLLERGPEGLPRIELALPPAVDVGPDPY
jgi:soluble lytic murein transglycosylase